MIAAQDFSDISSTAQDISVSSLVDKIMEGTSEFFKNASSLEIFQTLTGYTLLFEGARILVLFDGIEKRSKSEAS